MVLKDNTKSYMITGWIGLAATYVFLVMPHLNRPIIGWEALVWDIPRTIAAHGYTAVRFFYLPPLYDSLIALCFQVFGLSEASARLPGMICFLLMPPLIYLIAGEITEQKDRMPVGLIACAIFFTAPLIVQGSLLIDRSDTTLLTLAIAMFYLALLKTENRSLAFRSVLLGVIYAACLWVKLTTPLACLAAIPLAYIICGRIKYGIRLSLGVFTVGIALFIATWGGFCYLVVGIGRFFEPLGYYGAAASGTALAIRSGILIRMALDAFRIYLWFSPFLLVLGILAALDLLRKLFKDHSVSIKDTQLLMFAGIVAVGYLYANATFSGFPKYVVPVMPMLACLVAKFVWDKAGRTLGRKGVSFLIASICIGIAYYAFFVKDWIYAVYSLRYAQFTGLLGAVISNIIYQQALYILFPIAVLLLSIPFIPAPFIKRLSLAILIALVVSNMALNIIQRNAAYAVNFAYGTQGAEELKAFLIAKQPANAFSSIEGYVANVGNVTFRGINADVWDDPKKLSVFLAQGDPECLIYGLAANTSAQLKGTMSDPAVRTYLNSGYDQTVLGSYNVLLKKRRLPW